jgi:hypothetical protein
MVLQGHLSSFNGSWEDLVDRQGSNLLHVKPVSMEHSYASILSQNCFLHPTILLCKLIGILFANS